MTAKRFIVEIEKNKRSACILDTETIELYMLVKFSRTDTKTKKKGFIDELYRLCNLLNDLEDRRYK